MNNNFLKYISLIRVALIMAILFSLLATACTGRKKKANGKNLIPEKELITVLAEVHIANGLLYLPEIRREYYNRDSILNYIDILEKHGYSKEDMDRTIKYYFIKNPKKLIKIYDEALGRLSEMESLNEKQIPDNRIIPGNIWNGNPVYSFPDLSGTETLLFDHQLEKPGYYTFSFTATVYPDDQSLNPRFIAYFCHPDSIETGKRDYYTSVDFIKDGRQHTYTLSRKPRSDSFTHLRGWFIDYDNNNPETLKHSRIDNITLTCIPLV